MTTLANYLSAATPRRSEISRRGVDPSSRQLFCTPNLSVPLRLDSKGGNPLDRHSGSPVFLSNRRLPRLSRRLPRLSRRLPLFGSIIPSLRS
jgi:hypothetical protein